MKKKLGLSIFIIAIFISIRSNAQKNSPPSQGFIASLEPSTKANEQFSFPEIENFDGTYQFIVKQKKNFLFTTETFQIIENNRKESEDVTVTLNEFLDVFIYSKQSVNQSAFKPFKTSFILK